MPQPPRCASCGEPMSEGTLGVMSYVAGATWHSSRSTLALGGEKIAGRTLGGMIWLDGSRCANCRILHLRY